MKTLTVSLLSALCLAAPAWAGQGTPADSVRHLQGVEVTARLRQEQGINPLGVPAKKLPLTTFEAQDEVVNPLRIAERREERAVLVIRRAPLLASREEATSVEVQTISDLPPDIRTQIEVAQ